jgi:SRSO17 transposase
MDSFDTQIQCEEFYMDQQAEWQRELELEEMRWRESDEFCAYVNFLADEAVERRETPEFLAYVALVQADQAAGRH